METRDKLSNENVSKARRSGSDRDSNNINIAQSYKMSDAEARLDNPQPNGAQYTKEELQQSKN